MCRVKVCSGCGVQSYCSEKCQKEDWRAGHKRECKMNTDTRATAKEMRRELSGRVVVTRDFLDACKDKKHGRRADLLLASPGRRARQMQRIQYSFDNNPEVLREAMRPFIYNILASIYVADAMDDWTTVPKEDVDALAGCVVIEPLGIQAQGEPKRNEHAVVSFRTTREMRERADDNDLVLSAMEQCEHDGLQKFCVCILAATCSNGRGEYSMVVKTLSVDIRFMYCIESGIERRRADIGRLARGICDNPLQFLEENTPRRVWITV